MPQGPLDGIAVLEFASLAPAPFACTVLSDLGAEVLRVDRPGGAEKPVPAPPATGGRDNGTGDSAGAPPEPLGRGRRSVGVDLKHPAGIEVALRLAGRADVLVEGFRPGVMERLGLGPKPCLARNPRLVYARMTGWGQDGPLAPTAGHDINYLALSGALEPLGPADGPPLPPSNYVADFGGGGMLLAVGVLAALVERASSGRGQVVDAAMAEGAALITSLMHGLRAQGLWERDRGRNLFDGSAPFYTTYACADGRFIAVGAVEPQFYAQVLYGLGLTGELDPALQYDREGWLSTRRRFAEVFATLDRDAWAERFAGTDACVTPVLSPWEAHQHPHNVARGTFTEVAGLRQPAPAPRLSRTPGAVQGPAPAPGGHTAAALRDWGFDAKEIGRLRASGAIG